MNEESKDNLPEIITNESMPHDSTVVVEEKDRTVILTDEETIIIPKEQLIDIPPKNRSRFVNAGMFGISEIVAVSLGLLSILAMILFYMFSVAPARAKLNEYKSQRNELESQLATARRNFGTVSDTQTKVGELVKSVDNFEYQYLPVAATGRTALYQRLNNLIAAYDLINTTGPDYAPLEVNDRQGQTEAERGRAKFQSLFPGVYATMTVEGSYANLRRFVQQIEAGSEFVVISAVEFQPADSDDKSNQKSPTQTQQQPPPQIVENPNQKYARPAQQIGPNGQIGYTNPANPTLNTQPAPVNRAPRGKTHGETVSLHLELAAYFKRNIATPEPATVNTQVTVEK